MNPASFESCDMPVGGGSGSDSRNGTLEAIEVAHAHNPDVPTLAWRISTGARALVYASDVSRPERRLARFARGPACS